MISGSSSANVVASGTFTIPMMIKTGYSPRFSAAVESVASTGGQMTPPILGAAAFIIAELTGTPYLDIALATVIPALLYFTSIYYMIDLEALKLSLMGHKAEDLPNVRSLIVRRGHLLIPILVLLYVMIVMKASVVKAAIFGIYATVLCTFLRRDTRITVNKAVAGIADGAKQAVGLISACRHRGLIIGVLEHDRYGAQIRGGGHRLLRGSIPVALFLTMCASLVLGMGLPTAAAYLICAAVVAPALTGLGVPVLTANLFIFYFACLSQSPRRSPSPRSRPRSSHAPTPCPWPLPPSGSASSRSSYRTCSCTRRHCCSRALPSPSPPPSLPRSPGWYSSDRHCRAISLERGAPPPLGYCSSRRPSR